jgi:hypothetical protein
MSGIKKVASDPWLVAGRKQTANPLTRDAANLHALVAAALAGEDSNSRDRDVQTFVLVQ